MATGVKETEWKEPQNPEESLGRQVVLTLPELATGKDNKAGAGPRTSTCPTAIQLAAFPFLLRERGLEGMWEDEHPLLQLGNRALLLPA